MSDSLARILAAPATCPSSLDYARNPHRARLARLGKRRGPVHLGMVLFDGFEILDVFGPLEMLSVVTRFRGLVVHLVAATPGRLRVRADPLGTRRAGGRRYTRCARRWRQHGAQQAQGRGPS